MGLFRDIFSKKNKSNPLLDGSGDQELVNFDKDGQDNKEEQNASTFYEQDSDEDVEDVDDPPSPQKDWMEGVELSERYISFDNDPNKAKAVLKTDANRKKSKPSRRRKSSKVGPAAAVASTGGTTTNKKLLPRKVWIALGLTLVLFVALISAGNKRRFVISKSTFTLAAAQGVQGRTQLIPMAVQSCYTCQGG